MTMTRRSLFGLALLPVLPTPIPARRVGLAPGHISADPPLLVTDMAGGPIMDDEYLQQLFVLCRYEANEYNTRWRVVSDSNRPETVGSAEIGMGR